MNTEALHAPRATDTQKRAAALETEIKEKGAEAMRLAAAGNSKAARACYVELAALVAQRSPETVARMEAQRGLR
jgi:hypothetical protein